MIVVEFKSIAGRKTPKQLRRRILLKDTRLQNNNNKQNLGQMVNKWRTNGEHSHAFVARDGHAVVPGSRIMSEAPNGPGSCKEEEGEEEEVEGDKPKSMWSM